MNAPESPKEELKELRHEPWPGYAKKFVVVFAVTGLWLLVILVWGVKLGVYVGH